MKTKKLLVISLVVICFINVALSQQPTFQKAYGGSANEKGNSVQQTTDEGYIITGSTESFGVKKGYTDVYLVKTDIKGDTLWTKTFGGDKYDEGFAVCQISDLGYIVVGHTNSFGNGAYDVYLIRTDMNGNMLWSKTYGGTLDDYGFDVKQTTDGGFIITGKTLNFGVNSDVYLIKTDGAGDLLWTRTFGKDGDDAGYSVQQTKDGGYIVGGTRSKGGFYLIKTTSAGDTLWTKTSYAGTTPHINVAYSVQQTADDGYIMAGITYPIHFFLIKTASDGTTQWSKIIGGEAQDYALSVRQTTDGGYIIGGWTMSFSVGSYHSLLIRIDASGEIIWAKTYKGGGTSPVGYSVKQTVDGGFVFLGSASGAGFGAGLWDMYLVKTDENGNSGDCNQGDASPTVTSVTTTSKPSTSVGSGGTAISPLTIVGRGCTVTALCSTVGTFDIINNSSLTVYPNPFSNEVIIKGTKQDEVIILFDGNGKEILRTITYEGETRINTQLLTSGLYLLKYIADNKSTCIKLMKY
jgi:hypothetical protein